MTKNELKAAWESGFRLDYAWIEFARFFDHFSWVALCTHPNNEAEISAHPRYKQLKKGWLPQTWEARQLKLEITQKNERTNVLQEIYAGKLWAIGFRTLENGGDEPVRISRQRFFVDENGEPTAPINIDWAKGELTSAAESYFDIRVVRPPADDETALPDEGTSVARAGRPNTSAQIRRKVEELWKTAEFQSIASRIEQARDVRARLKGRQHRLDDDLPGYRSSVIQRIIGEVATAQSGRTGETE